MSDTYVTLQGWVGTDVQHRTASGATVANFRVATTPRLKRKGEWVDGDTTWYSVACWRTLGENVCASVRKGDAVIVHGKLRSDLWKREDGDVSRSFVVDASFVGHDLSRGTSTFVRQTRVDRTEPDVHDEVTEMFHQGADLDDTRVDSWGTGLAGSSEETAAVGAGASFDPPEPVYPEDRGEPAA